MFGKSDKKQQVKDQTQAQEKPPAASAEAAQPGASGAAATTAGVAPDKQVAAAAKTAVGEKLDFGPLAGQSNVGMEDADRESFALPFILVLQKLSPQLDRKHSEYLGDGVAKDGDFFNTATRKTYPGAEGFLFVHVAFKRSFTKWGLREKGGGYKGEFAPSDPIIATTRQDEKNRNILPDNLTQLVDTRMHGIVLIDGDQLTPALLSLTSTAIKTSKRFMTDMQEKQKGDGLPTFAHIYRATSIDLQKDQNSWSGWKIEYVEPVTNQEVVDAAVAFHSALTSGARTMQANNAAGAPDA